MKLTDIITFVIIAAAVAYFIWRVVGMKKGKSGCSCCSGAGECGAKDGECHCGCCGHAKN